MKQTMIRRLEELPEELFCPRTLISTEWFDTMAIDGVNVDGVLKYLSQFKGRDFVIEITDDKYMNIKKMYKREETPQEIFDRISSYITQEEV